MYKFKKLHHSLLHPSLPVRRRCLAGATEFRPGSVRELNKVLLWPEGLVETDKFRFISHDMRRHAAINQQVTRSDRIFGTIACLERG